MTATISRKSLLTGGLAADSRFLPGNFPTAGVAAVARKLIAERRRKYPYPVEDTTAHTAMPALKKSIGTAQTATWDMGAALHLLKRTLSAPTWQEVRDASAMTRADMIEMLLADAPLPASPADWVTEPRPVFDSLTEEEIQAIIDTYFSRNDKLMMWWLSLIQDQATSLRESMTLFWHNHFATGTDKVLFPQAVYQQMTTLRQYGLGNFRELLRRITFGPAMMIWLDITENRKQSPNENFARELMELYTLGVNQYTQNDVEESARAFTGYTTDGITSNYDYQAASGVDGFDRAGMVPDEQTTGRWYRYWSDTHDFEPKTYGQAGNWDGDGTHYIVVNRSVRDAIKVTAGDVVHVLMERDNLPRTVELPADFAEALESNQPLGPSFESLSYSRRKEFIDWIGSAKKAETRDRRIAKSLEMLQKGTSPKSPRK